MKNKEMRRNIYIDDKTIEMLDVLCEKNNRSKSNMIRYLIKKEYEKKD